MSVNATEMLSSVKDTVKGENFADAAKNRADATAFWGYQMWLIPREIKIKTHYLLRIH